MFERTPSAPIIYSSLCLFNNTCNIAVCTTLPRSLGTQTKATLSVFRNASLVLEKHLEKRLDDVWDHFQPTTFQSVHGS